MPLDTLDFALNDDHDVFVSGTEFALVSGADAVTQEADVRLRWWQGEWFLDRGDGTPYLGGILGRGVTEATVAAILKEELIKVPNLVDVVVTPTIDRAARHLSVDLRARASDGTQIVVSIQI
jgi:hypothetical protein